MSGYVYVIESSAGLFKVGYSANPQRRVLALSTSTADRLTLRAAVPGTMSDEKDIHEALAPWRVGREWFEDCLPIRALIEVGVTKSDPKPADTSAHALIVYAKGAKRSMQSIATEAGCCRLTLHRIVRGQQNATVDLLKRISAATDGAVSVSDLLTTPMEEVE